MNIRTASRGASREVAWPAFLVLLGSCCGLAALSLAVQHPVVPLAVPLASLLISFGVAARPQALWFLLPAALPVMSFAPWTGWWLFDESDILVLSCLAGAFFRWGLDLWRNTPAARKPWKRSFILLWMALALSLLIGVLRGLEEAGLYGMAAPTWNEAVYAGYDSAWNTLRVAKSLLWALQIGLLLHAPVVTDRRSPPRLVANGMVVGLALVCLVAMWERVVYAGLFDFSRAYRTSAWFWEMHVGGGAIDAYLAMAVPFAAWAMWTSPTAWRWAGAHLLMAFSVYVVLTTYSRGVYLAVLIALLFMGITAWRFKLAPAAGPTWGRRTLLAMGTTLVLESALVLGGGTFMADRLARSDADLVGRMEHWRSSLGLLDSPKAWVTGLGIGRFPANYSRAVEGGHFPGEALWRGDPAQGTHVLLSGKRKIGQRADLFLLTQRVDLDNAGPVRVRVKAGGEPGGKLLVSLCERHLLYDFACQWRWVSVNPLAQAEAGWVEFRMGTKFFGDQTGIARLRERVIALSPAQAGQAIRIEGVEMWDSSGRQRLLNADFSQGLQHWLPVSQGQFQPWHTDNLYLDVLVERGLLGLVVLAAWVWWALNNLHTRVRQGDLVAWALAGSLTGMLSLGAVISVTEVPRVSLILLILLWSSTGFRGQMEGAS